MTARHIARALCQSVSGSVLWALYVCGSLANGATTGSLLDYEPAARWGWEASMTCGCRTVLANRRPGYAGVHVITPLLACKAWS